MKKILKYTLLLSFALVSANQIWNNFNFENETITIIKVAAILAIFEILLKPIIKILLLPINILTLGTIRMVIDTVGLYIAVFLLNDFHIENIFISASTWQGFSIPQFKFNGFFAYLISSLTVSFLLYMYNLILTKKVSKL